MLPALVFGLIGSSALVLGSAVGSFWRPPVRLSAVLLAFASGTLISALAFELFPAAVELGGLWPAGLGLLAGAAAFVLVDTWLDARVSKRAGEVGFALLAAVTLDGVPENLALGVSLLADGGSLTLLVAIFASNLPEALVGAGEMRRSGKSRAFTIGIWALAAVLLTAAVVVGRVLLARVAMRHLAFPLAFAGGAVLASLADTLMPEAFEHGRPLNALATAAGFFLSFVLAGG